MLGSIKSLWIMRVKNIITFVSLLLYSCCEPWWSRTLFLLFEHNFRIFHFVLQPCQPSRSVHYKFMIIETRIVQTEASCCLWKGRLQGQCLPGTTTRQPMPLISSPHETDRQVELLADLFFATPPHAVVPWDCASAWFSDGLVICCRFCLHVEYNYARPLLKGWCFNFEIYSIFFCWGSILGHLQTGFQCSYLTHCQRGRSSLFMYFSTHSLFQTHLLQLHPKACFSYLCLIQHSCPCCFLCCLLPVTALDCCSPNKKYVIFSLNFLHRIPPVFSVISTLLSIRLRTLAPSLDICFLLPVCSVLQITFL